MLLPMLASAYQAEIDGIYYDFSGDEASVTYGYSNLNSYSGIVVIPDSVIYSGKTYAVTSIGYAFYGCRSLTSVTIAKSIKSIVKDAFSHCSGLQKVIVPDITTWCNISFGNESANPLYYAHHLYSNENTEITNLIIPNSVTNIGSDAFNGCSSLVSLTFGSGVLSIGNNAFLGCNRIAKVIWLPNTPPSGYRGVNGAMNYVSNDNYTGLSNTTVYPFLSSMFEVEGIKYVPVSPSERTCDAIDCSYNESAENINIGESVTYRGVSLSLKRVNPYLCYRNTYIKNVKLNFIGDVSNYAFASCNNMQTIELGQEITAIGGSSFSGCSKLESVIIPDSVSSIGTSAFSGCSSMKSVKIGSGTKIIPTHAFNGCSSLQDVQIGNGVTSINSSAFSYCITLPSIQIPQNVTTIENNVFDNCNSLKTVLMDDGEAELYIGINDNNPLFVSCPLDSVYIGRNITYPIVSDKGYSPFYNNKSLRTIIITGKETEITESEFNGCSALQTVELGQRINSISGSAFKNCSKLQSIVIPDSVNSMGSNTFENCSAMTYAKIGNGLKSIPTYAFSNCSSLPAIQIPQNVATIGNYVFNGCTSLKTVLMDEGEGELNLGSNGSSPLFVNCPLDTVYIGRNITYPTASNKGYSPFYRNTSLRSVSITDKETEISTNEFYGCTNLKNVRIGDGVTTIGDWAFSGCSSLDYFSFGSSVECIGKEAFSDCSAMTSLVSKAETPPTCGSQALDDINKWECTLMVPDGFVEAYQAAPQWKEFFFVEVDPDGINEIKNESLTPALSKGEGDRYSLDGRKMVNGKLSNGKLPRGINIIRYADGTTRKVMVK